MQLKHLFSLLVRYVKYRFAAKMRGGHGIHSPYLFHFYCNVLYGKSLSEYDERPERLRRRYRNCADTLANGSPGPASHVGRRRSVARLSRRMGVTRADGRLLYRVAKALSPRVVVELGTGLGISAAYMATGYPSAKVYSIEANGDAVSLVQKAMHETGIGNVECIQGQFAEELPALLQRLRLVDLVFIDGDHTFEGTLRYVELLLQHAHPDTLIFIHDIHWSAEMERAWQHISANKQVAIAVDLFSIGMLSLRKGTAKHNLILRY